MSTSSFWSGPVRGGTFSPALAASHAAMAAAENLVHKAVQALGQGDENRARRLATQAARRPFDDHEGVWPGPWAAHYALFELVTDAVVDWPQDDHTWVDVLADLTSQVSGRQLDEVRHLAAVLHQDARLLSIDEVEARMLRRLAAGADPAAQPRDEVLEEERPAYVLDLARLVLELQTRLHAESP